MALMSQGMAAWAVAEYVAFCGRREAVVVRFHDVLGLSHRSTLCLSCVYSPLAAVRCLYVESGE